MNEIYDSKVDLNKKQSFFTGSLLSGYFTIKTHHGLVGCSQMKGCYHYDLEFCLNGFCYGKRFVNMANYTNHNDIRKIAIKWVEVIVSILNFDQIVNELTPVNKEEQ